MNIKSKKIILDLDNTISFAKDGDYINAKVDKDLVKKIRYYKKQGFEIVISTSRNMRTYAMNLGKINANTLPIILEWLEKNKIPFDEIYIAKPWCGEDGFYVDDRAIRPNEFKNLSYNQIINLIEKK